MTLGFLLVFDSKISRLFPMTIPSCQRAQVPQIKFDPVVFVNLKPNFLIPLVDDLISE